MKKKQVKTSKLFIIRKYVWADSAKEAIKADSKTDVADCWLDEDWKKAQGQTPEIIGFERNAK